MLDWLTIDVYLLQVAAGAAAWCANEKMHRDAQPVEPDGSTPSLVLAEGAAWDQANALRAAGFADDADAVLTAFYDSLSE
jgi:hypothetical protein